MIYIYICIYTYYYSIVTTMRHQIEEGTSKQFKNKIFFREFLSNIKYEYKKLNKTQIYYNIKNTKQYGILCIVFLLLISIIIYQISVGQIGLRKRRLLKRRSEAKRQYRDTMQNVYKKMLDDHFIKNLGINVSYIGEIDTKAKSIPKTYTFLNDKNIRYKAIYGTAHDMIELIKNNDISIQDIITLHSKRCIEASKQFTLVADEMYDKGLNDAINKDLLLKTYKNFKNDQLLYGIPISVKDSINVYGMDSTCGVTRLCFSRHEEDAVVVKLLRKQGAIPIARGNVPQCLMLPEVENNIYGRSCNPWNPLFSTGGSSGGDAGLVSYRAVPIAIGSDIGGSLRIPSHYCGVYTLKPTPYRISRRGCVAPTLDGLSGQQYIQVVPGPIANCVEDLVLVMKSWLVPEMSILDPYIPYTGFNNLLYDGSVKSSKQDLSTNNNTKEKTTKPTKLTIGYYTFDGYTDICETGIRAVKISIDILKKNGHICKPFIPPDIESVVYLYMTIFSSDGKMKSILQALQGENVVPQYSYALQLSHLPPIIRNQLSIIYYYYGEKRVSKVLKKLRKRDTFEYLHIIKKIENYKLLYEKKMKDENIDVIICPSSFGPALRHGTCSDILPFFVTFFVWNLLHYPVGCLPITTVQGNENLNYYKNAVFKDRLTFKAHKAIYLSDGLPYGIQVACKPYHDEQVLRVMLELQNGINRKFIPSVVSSHIDILYRNDDEIKQLKYKKNQDDISGDEKDNIIANE